jgi:hypothetical protein
VIRRLRMERPMSTNTVHTATTITDMIWLLWRVHGWSLCRATNETNEERSCRYHCESHTPSHHFATTLVVDEV